MTDQEIERIATKHIRWIKPEHGIFYDDEVLSFARAIIAAQLAAPGAPTDQQIVDTLARHGIGWGDEQGVTAYPLDGEDAPIYIAAVRELLAAPGAPEHRKADFYCFPAGTYPIAKPAPGERQPVAWLWIEHGKPVNALLRRPNPDDLYWKEKGFTAEPLFRA